MNLALLSTAAPAGGSPVKVAVYASVVTVFVSSKCDVQSLIQIQQTYKHASSDHIYWSQKCP